jgi:hypothetical protein
MVRGFHRGTFDARRLGRPRVDGRFFFQGNSPAKGPSCIRSSIHALSRKT